MPSFLSISAIVQELFRKNREGRDKPPRRSRVKTIVLTFFDLQRQFTPEKGDPFCHFTAFHRFCLKIWSSVWWPGWPNCRNLEAGAGKRSNMSRRQATEGEEEGRLSRDHGPGQVGV